MKAEGVIKFVLDTSILSPVRTCNKKATKSREFGVFLYVCDDENTCEFVRMLVVTK